MLCETIKMDLRQTDDGKTIPTHLVAGGDVTVIDTDQRMWARRPGRDVPRGRQGRGHRSGERPRTGREHGWRRRRKRRPTCGRHRRRRGGGDDPFQSGDVEVERLHARGNVQLLLSGRRACLR